MGKRLYPRDSQRLSKEVPGRPSPHGRDPRWGASPRRCGTWGLIRATSDPSRGPNSRGALFQYCCPLLTGSPDRLHNESGLNWNPFTTFLGRLVWAFFLEPPINCSLSQDWAARRVQGFPPRASPVGEGTKPSDNAPAPAPPGRQQKGPPCVAV